MQNSTMQPPPSRLGIKVLCLLALSPVIFLFPVVTARADAATGHEWTITLEEPTGIYRRDNEVVTVQLNLPAGLAWPDRLEVLAPDGREVTAQVEVSETHPDGSIKIAELLFRATMIPGERPQFRLVTTARRQGSGNGTSIVARKIGTSRLELGNERFGVILNLGLENTEPAIVSAFNKSAGEARMLNLVETTPDGKVSPPFGKSGSGFGTFLGELPRSGAFDQVKILESGPLRAKVQISGSHLGDAGETWEFVLLAGSPVLRWKARIDADAVGTSYGFCFSSVSATPYLPFDRWIDGSQERFPDGWETDSPPDQKIGPGEMADLPGGHLLYYQREENYGALGFYELDKELLWKGVGAPAFCAFKTLNAGKRSIETALAFPRWKGTESVLEARMEYRRFVQPILSVISEAANHGAVQQNTKTQAGDRIIVRPVADLKRHSPETIPELDLSGQWKLQWAEKADGEKRGFFRPEFNDASWRVVSVPGSVHTQILEAPRYYTREAEWISEKEWWYRRTFRVPPIMYGKRLRLRFEATDYYADIWLNGHLLGRHEGYMDPYEFDVSGRVNPEGLNHLAVRVWTPVSYYWRHRPYTVKGSYGAVDQKPDNITAEGITRPVRLMAGGRITIRDLAVDTRLNQDGSADVILDLDLDSGSEAVPAADLAVTLRPRNFEDTSGLELKSQCTVSPGGGSHRLVLHLQNPRLWWTWDHGRPDLYTLDVSVTDEAGPSDRRSCAIGIREIEMVDWKFYLNGRRMFVRGTNSYYNLFQSEMRRADYERDLGLLKAMNVNMIRLHCHFNNPDYYDLADELGILIWQDYLEAWYPEDRDFALKAAGLYDPHIRLVRNHPSVAIWATSDEESLENYRVLTKHLEPRVYAIDPQCRPVVRSTGRYGDGHIYYGWYEGSIWQYTKMTEKFVSELGATALPNYESLIKFLPDAWPIEQHEEEWIFRKLQIPEAMRAWGRPDGMTLQEYIPQTQNYVARLFQLAIERMRRLKYQPAGGILHFHAIDIWPSVTMAALDFWRQPTKAYKTVQRSFQMVLPSFDYDRDTWKSGETIRTGLWLINDHWYAIPRVSVAWRLESEKGEVISRDGLPNTVDLGADASVNVTNVSLTAGTPGKYTLWARITDAQGKVISENNYEFQVR